MKIPTFLYFMDQYRDVLQLSDTDLIKLFGELESDENKKKLLNEVLVIEKNLRMEDWEMEKSASHLCSKYSKRRIKRIIQLIQNEL